MASAPTTALDWILGVLFHPSATFAAAKSSMRLEYWWIMTLVFTLEIVSAVWSPSAQETRLDTSMLVLYSITFMMILFDVQALLLWGAARLVSWKLPWTEALKYIGLAWSALFLEDVITFYPALKGYHWWVLMFGLPMFIWYVLSLSAGVKALTGLPTWKALGIVLAASLPWRAAILWLSWTGLTGSL